MSKYAIIKTTTYEDEDEEEIYVDFLVYKTLEEAFYYKETNERVGCECKLYKLLELD